MQVVLRQQYPSPSTASSNESALVKSAIDASCREFAKSAATTALQQATTLDVATVKEWKSSTNVYIKGLPDQCTDNDLVQWARLIAEPVSVKALRVQGVEELCNGVGFVRFHMQAHAAAFLDMVNARDGLEAWYAKETYAAKMQRAGDGQSANLYLSHIPLTYGEQEVSAIFPPERYSIQSIRLLNEGDRPQYRAIGTRFRGAGFVRLATREEAEMAVAELNGKLLPGHQRLKNGHFETLQVRFADTEAQKVVKASVKLEQKAAGVLVPLLRPVDQLPQPAKTIMPPFVDPPETPTKPKTPQPFHHPDTGYLSRHISSPSNASTLSSSVSTASSSPILSILSTNPPNQAPWAASAPPSSTNTSPITPFYSPLPPTAGNYSFPPVNSFVPAGQVEQQKLNPAMLPPHPPNNLLADHARLQQSIGAQTLDWKTMMESAGIPLPVPQPSAFIPPCLPVVGTLPPSSIPTVPLPTTLAASAEGAADPFLASLLASAFQQGQISARMQALSADIELQRQSLEAQLGSVPLPLPGLQAPTMPLPGQQVGPFPPPLQRDWPPHLPSGLVGNDSLKRDSAPLMPVKAQGLYSPQIPFNPVEALQANVGLGQLNIAGLVSGLGDTASAPRPGDGAGSRRGSLGIEEDFPDPPAAPVETQALRGLGISGLSRQPVLAREMQSKSPGRPRANTAAAAHVNPFDAPTRKSSFLAVDSALARRSSAIENASLINEGRGEILHRNETSAAAKMGRLGNKPSVTFSEVPRPALDRAGSSSEKVVLPYSKTLRSYSAFGLDTPELGLGDSGYGAPSPMQSAGLSPHDHNAGKYVIPSRRSSHIGLVSPPTAFPGNISHSLMPGLRKAPSRPSMQHKGLRESFSSMSLRNGSTKEEREDASDNEGEEIEESLTQISPTYTFGTSYASTSNQSAYENHFDRFGRQQLSMPVTHPKEQSSDERKYSDASSASQDVTEQYKWQSASQERRSSRDEIKDGEMTESERFLRSLLSKSRKTSLPVGL